MLPFLTVEASHLKVCQVSLSIKRVCNRRGTLDRVKWWIIGIVCFNSVGKGANSIIKGIYPSLEDTHIFPRVHSHFCISPIQNMPRWRNVSFMCDDDDWKFLPSRIVRSRRPRRSSRPHAVRVRVRGRAAPAAPIMLSPPLASSPSLATIH